MICLVGLMLVYESVIATSNIIHEKPVTRFIVSGADMTEVNACYDSLGLLDYYWARV